MLILYSLRSFHTARQCEHIPVWEEKKRRPLQTHEYSFHSVKSVTIIKLDYN